LKVLVLGGGQIAKAVGEAAFRQHQVVTRTRSDLDIVDEHSVALALSMLKPDWVVNAAAFTAVDLAEDQPALAHAVNDGAVASLVRASAQERCSASFN
jgi:dTDP-4-dehydrorhamnose reductase